jgi:hypothetical protein
LAALDQCLERHLIRVIVAADKLYVAKPFHLAAGGGKLGASSDAKSSAVDTAM